MLFLVLFFLGKTYKYKSCVALKGIFAKGLLGCTGFSLLRWEKGSETPSCGGEKGLRLPLSSCSDLGNEGVSDPFPHRKGSLRPFVPRQRENLVHPKIHLAKIPLAQRIDKVLTKRGLANQCSASPRGQLNWAGPIANRSYTKSLKTLTSLNKQVRPFFLGDTSIWSFPSVSSLSDCSFGLLKAILALRS